MNNYGQKTIRNIPPDVGKPEDIARMCVFLCQDENDFINGENITIDGGMTKKDDLLGIALL